MEKLFFYQKCVQLDENTFLYCGQIIEVHVLKIQALYSKVHPACHNIANRIKLESN